MADDAPQVERRDRSRYRVQFRVIAHRGGRDLPSFVRTRVPITVVDISESSLCWHAREVFYNGELLALCLPTDDPARFLQCAVRVKRVRRIRGQYEVVGGLVQVSEKKIQAGGAGADRADRPAEHPTA